MIRTRVAPSPTGPPHLGTAYVALFNLCFARSQSGQFLLRMEDTDRSRSSAAWEEAILKAYRWLGLDWDEGPDRGGPSGPYRQSERGEIYRRHVEQLLEAGHAFHCFATAEELEQMRRQQRQQGLPVGYDGRGLALGSKEVARRLAAGEPHVVRMKVPEEGECVVADLLRSEVRVGWGQVDMQVLLKADGMPTYHLANVVDDHLMGISHVIRGEEWINSTPKHLLLYRYFDWKPPSFAHLPLLRNPDRSKLSKRRNPVGIDYYRRMGYLPEALLNYLGRMGWSMPDGNEHFSLQEMQEHFSLERISLGGPIFDLERLDWLNGAWIRKLSLDDLIQRLVEWGFNEDYGLRILTHLQPRMNRLSDVARQANFLFAGHLHLDERDFAAAKLDLAEQQRILQCTLWRLEELVVWERQAIYDALRRLAQSMGHGLHPFLEPLFVAITGSTASISIMDALDLLGSDLSRARLLKALELTGGVSQRQRRAWEKEYRAFV